MTCKTCQKMFLLKPSAVKKGYGKFCSKPCYGKSLLSGKMLICQTCKVEFYMNGRQISEGRGRYCSDECRYKNSGRLIECPVCGKKKYKMNSQLGTNNHYCSQHCCNIGRRKRIIRICIHCGKDYEGLESQNRKFCSRKCMDKYPISDEQRERLINMRLNLVFKSPSSIEIKMKNILTELGESFTEQHTIRTSYVRGQFDFALEKDRLFIECDGNYWHNTPRGIRQDRLKERYCQEYGWDLIRFSEDNINKQLDDCKESIKRVLSIIRHV